MLNPTERNPSRCNHSDRTVFDRDACISLILTFINEINENPTVARPMQVWAAAQRGYKTPPIFFGGIELEKDQ
jgi:hypothetical protein